eukprot:1156099-Pelagomonas_calceolata.AAC.3
MHVQEGQEWKLTHILAVKALQKAPRRPDIVHRHTLDLLKTIDAGEQGQPRACAHVGEKKKWLCAM